MLFGNWYYLLGLFVPALMLAWIWMRDRFPTMGLGSDRRVSLPQDFGVTNWTRQTIGVWTGSQTCGVGYRRLVDPRCRTIGGMLRLLIARVRRASNRSGDGEERLINRRL